VRAFARQSFVLLSRRESPNPNRALGGGWVADATPRRVSTHPRVVAVKRHSHVLLARAEQSQRVVLMRRSTASSARLRVFREPFHAARRRRGVGRAKFIPRLDGGGHGDDARAMGKNAVSRRSSGARARDARDGRTREGRRGSAVDAHRRVRTDASRGRWV